jgi:regulatory protein
MRSRRNPSEEPSGPPDPAALREYALRLLAMQSRSETEIERKLARRGADQDTIDALVADFRQRGWLDDNALAERWVESRGASRGRNALSFELRRRGLDPTGALAERTDDDEKAAAWNAATRKAGDPPTVRGQAGRLKLAAYLQRRGFSYGVVRTVLDKTIVEPEPPADSADPDEIDDTEEQWESD